MTAFKELLSREFAPYGDLTVDQLDKLESHYRLLTQWNTRLNLTRIRSFEDSVRLHFCESLYLAKALPSGALRIVDVGSGAGFPGIPIGILRPECSIVLVESHQRKAVFLREAVRSITNIATVAGRAEDLGEQFDWIVSRAVTPKEVLSLNLAPNWALLVGAGEFPEAKPLPWGEQRFLAIVSRGT